MDNSVIGVLDDASEADTHVYRALSKAAVLSLALSVLSLPAILIPPLLAMPLLGCLLGYYAYRNIRRYPEELTGGPVALAGQVLGAALFAVGLAAHSAIYATEVPDGYVRIGFEDLQPSSEHPEVPFSPEALELDGKRVFVKGYVYPDGQQANIRHFVLVRDMGTCCFGGQPKLTHMIEVTLEDPLRVAYSIRKWKLGGVLKVDSQLKQVSGLGGVYFQLKADYLR